MEATVGPSPVKVELGDETSTNNLEAEDFKEKPKKGEKLWWRIEDDAEHHRFNDFFYRYGNSNKCRLCPYLARDSSLFGKHITEEHTECERYQCKFCTKEFLHLLRCMYHIEKSHYDLLEKEEEKSRIAAAKGLPKIYPYRNCYTIIPSAIDFAYVKANMFLYDRESSDEDEERASNKKASETPDRELYEFEKDILKFEQGIVTDQNQSQTLELHSSPSETVQQSLEQNQGDFEIVDDDDNILFLDDSLHENDSLMSDSIQIAGKDIFEMPPVYDVEDDDNDEPSDLNTSTSSQSSLNSSFLQLHFQQENSYTKLPPPKKQTPKPKKIKPTATAAQGQYSKPMFSYSQLIYLAFKNSVDGYLFVSQVYLFIMEHFPYYKTAPSSWKNSIRHTLCGSKCFLKGPSAATVPGDTSLRKNLYWILSPDQNAIMKMEVEIDKVISRNYPNLSLTMPNPENLLLLQQGQLKKQYSRFGNGNVQDSLDADIDEPVQLNLTDGDFESPEDDPVQVQMMDASEAIPSTSYAPATTLSQALSANSAGIIDNRRSSHYRLVDNGVGLELQPMEEGESCMFYVYE